MKYKNGYKNWYNQLVSNTIYVKFKATLNNFEVYTNTGLNFKNIIFMMYIKSKKPITGSKYVTTICAYQH